MSNQSCESSKPGAPHARQRLLAKSVEHQPRGNALLAVPNRATPEVREYAYHLFRNKQRPQLICAVAEHRPLPSFLSSGQWLAEGSLGTSKRAPPGFREKAAAAGVQLNGFYLFHALSLNLKAGHDPSRAARQAA
jgi:hypothetical protein